ncbi:MAG: hypothetical protein N5P05_000755 [Chroococcopsis gigantea SAG 12.99]|nr:hypothetical protein [Chroococcopsis gigantea SAG 12.99]
MVKLTTRLVNQPPNSEEMDKVLIIVNADVRSGGKISKLLPVTERMVNGLKQAIPASVSVEVMSAACLWSKAENLKPGKHNIIWCPLTIQLPHWLDFPARDIYQKCRNIEERRLWVQQNLHYQTTLGESWLGDLWLPIVLTKKGPLYGEVIGEGMIPNSYTQPAEIDAEIKAHLYHLSYKLLDNLKATPSVYLLQFGLAGKEIIFDRLWPFPATPAIASLGVQKPDLYACYWGTLTNQPIADLMLAV